MVWSRRPAVEDPKLRLDALPSDFVVAPIGAARFIVGPTGAYIVLAHDGTPERPRALGRLAATIRSVLAERMAWVPFVHPLLVDTRSITVPQAMRSARTERIVAASRPRARGRSGVPSWASTM